MQPTREPIYSVEILGTGPEFDAVHAALDDIPNLPLPGASYLVSGEAVRNAMLAHHGRGDVVVTAHRAHPNEADEVLAPASVIAAFIGHNGRNMGIQFRWDAEALLWCLSSEVDGAYHESDDKSAPDELSAAKLALQDVLTDQEVDPT